MQRWMSGVWVEEDVGLGRGGKAVLKQPVLHKLEVWDQEMNNWEWALLGTEVLQPRQSRRGAGPTQECPANPLDIAFVNHPFAVSNVSGYLCLQVRGTPAGWRPCCFTEFWDNFLTSGFQSLIGFCSADGKLIHSEFKPTKLFFSLRKKLFKVSLETAWGTADHRVKNHKICSGRGFSSVKIAHVDVNSLHQQFWVSWEIGFWNDGAVQKIQPLFLQKCDKNPQNIWVIWSQLNNTWIPLNI